MIKTNTHIYLHALQFRDFRQPEDLFTEYLENR